MRLIDADALTKRYQEMMDYEQNYSSAPINWVAAFEDFIDSITSAPTIGGWISVKENLPKVSGHYLVSCVTNKTGHRWEVPVNAEWLTSRHEWYIETENCLASSAGVTVTHYMPLPEQPKENEDE